MIRQNAPVLATESASGRAWKILVDVGLIILGAVLFSLAFPHPLSDWGWFPFGYVALVPVFLVVRRASWGAIFPYGLLYGFIAYVFHNYWLLNFHPLSIFIVPVIYAFYFLVIFPLLKAADSFFPRYGYIVQVLIWMGYEYLRTQWFLGYSYGILGYSQYLFSPLVRLSSITGVWGVSFLVVFPSAYTASAIRDGAGRWIAFVRDHWIDLGIYLIAFVAAVGYGVVSTSDYTGSPTWRIALVQQNVDPLRGGVRAYEQSLDISLRQSRLALKEDPDIVVWSETSFVPGIDWHTRYRGSPESYELVRRLTEFMADQEVPYVIGNSDGQLRRAPSGELERVDYNAVVLYDEGEIVDTYRKIHLVPFTEHFPYRGVLTPIYSALQNVDTNFWRAGDEFTVFEVDGVKFSTPICFEDTFGYLSRAFVRNGAQIIVNLTNDSWSKSVPAAMQHMAMAVFRAAENRRSLVRSTNGGMTTIIDPNGVITDIYPAFVEGYLVGDVPIYDTETTLYTKWGDWFAFVCIGLSLAALVFGAVRALLRPRVDNGMNV